MTGLPWRDTGDGLMLVVRVTPRAARNAVEGLVETGDGRHALALRVRAAPSDGAANDAATRLLADSLDIPRRAVTLVSGQSARLKQFHLAGQASAMADRLDDLIKGE